MFTIIGGDGKEYGPATAEQIRAWIASGRANLDTKAKAVGSDEWRRLGDFGEFNGGATPPIVSAMPGASAAGISAPVPADQPDRGRRLLARLIDWIIAIIAVSPGMSILGSEMVRLVMMVARGEQPDFSQLDSTVLLRGGLIAGTGWLLVLIVQIVLLSTRGQSIGKVALGLRVVRFADGTQAGFLNAWLLRECLITVIGFVLGILPLLGLLLRPGFHLTDWCMIFRSDHRCLHDLIAGTRVVSVKKS